MTFNWNVTKMCRICLSNASDMIDLDDSPEGELMSYMQMFNMCTFLDATRYDEFPQTLCNTCKSELLIAFRFLRKAVKADNYFRDQVDLKYKEGDICVTEEDKPTTAPNGKQKEVNTTIIEDASSGDEVEIVDVSLPIPSSSKDLNEQEPLDKTSTLADSDDDDDMLDLEPAQPEPGPSRVTTNPKLPTPTYRLIEGKANIVVHKCHLCDRRYNTSNNLARHIRTIHTKRQKYECPEPDCDFSTLYSSNLRKHLKLHQKHSSSMDDDVIPLPLLSS